RRVLNVGQCGLDHGSIGQALQRAFSVEVEPAATHEEAIDAIRADPGRYALVLVNRVGDLDGAPGVDLVRGLKSDPALAGVPVMLVSNFPEAQAEAVAAGALPGFGKRELSSAHSNAILRSTLAPSPE